MSPPVLSAQVSPSSCLVVSMGKDDSRDKDQSRGKMDKKAAGKKPTKIKKNQGASKSPTPSGYLLV